ncbi:hypothetical protein ACWEKM_46570 [Streptomyces sp. NPDC004752]
MQAQISSPRPRLEVEKNTSLVALPKKCDGILENARGISASALIFGYFYSKNAIVRLILLTRSAAATTSNGSSPSHLRSRCRIRFPEPLPHPS